jgi:hypothetical protein
LNYKINLGVPKVLFPENNSTVYEGNVLIEWSGVSGANSYLLTINDISSNTVVCDKLELWPVDPGLALETYETYSYSMDSSFFIHEHQYETRIASKDNIGNISDESNNTIFTYGKKADIILDSITASISSLNVIAGSSIPIAGNLLIYAKYNDGSSIDITNDTNLTWSISNSKIAYMPYNGTIVGTKSGTTTLNLSYDGKSTSVSIIVVNKSLSSISASVSDLSLMEGESITISGNIKITAQYNDGSTKEITSDETLKWKINNTQIAYLPFNGTVVGIKNGSTTLKLSYANKSAVVNITVLKINVLIDNKYVLFNNSLGFPFLDKSGIVQVPLRATMEAIGVKMSYNSKTNIVYIVYNDNITVSIPINKNYIFINGEKVKNIASAIMIDDRVYCPIKKILEAFGSNVEWDSLTKTFVVSKSNLDLFDKSDDLKMECFALSELAYTTFNSSQLGKKINDDAIINHHKRYIQAKEQGNADIIWDGKNVTYSDWFLNTVGKWRLVDFFVSSITENSAVAFINEERKLLVVSYRGTDDVSDFLSDAKLAAFANLDEKFPEALEFFNTVNSKYKGKNYTTILTGHSLGGALATYVALNTGYSAQVFDTPSIEELAVTNIDGLANSRFNLTDWKDIHITNDINEHDNVGNQGQKMLETTIKHECQDPTIYTFQNPIFQLHNHLNALIPDHSHDFFTMLEENNGNFNFTPIISNGIVSPITNYVTGALKYETSEWLRDDLIFGTIDSNTLDCSSNELSNYIYGGVGDDTIEGGSADDIITGGGGTDTITDSMGNDIYLFGIGDGNDFIYDSSGVDTIIFKNGITPDMIETTDTGVNGLNYLIQIKGNSDSILISKRRSFNVINSFQLKFSDGTIIRIQDWNSNDWK